MANTYPTTTLTKNILIADDLQSSTTSGTTTTKTQIVLTNSSCGLEMQSTTCGFVLPRMTTTQRNALTGTAGMQVYNTTTGSVDTYSTAWVGGNSYATGTLTQANLTGMYANPVLILAAPGANYMYVVDQFVMKTGYNTTQFGAGGNIYLQYGNAANAAGPLATSAIANTLLTTSSNTAAATIGYSTVGALATMVNGALYITNASSAFTNGNANSTATYYLYYSTVSVA
jgi:hypothetical protein